MGERLTRHDDPVIGPLTRSDPARNGTVATAGIETALEEIGSAIVGRSRGGTPARPRRWRFRRRSVIAVALAVASIAGGAAAATKLLTADTGHYATGWQVKAGGPGQELRVWAPDFCRVALRLGTDIPYPPAYASWRPWVLVAELGLRHVTPNGPCGPDTQTPHGEVSSGAVRGFFAMSAFCAWVYDWRQAKLAGDHASTREAAAVIAAAPRWRAVLAEDPHPSASPPYTGSGQRGRMTIFGWFLPFRRAVITGDVSLVSQLMAGNYGTAGCPYFAPPASSHSGTMLPSRS